MTLELLLVALASLTVALAATPVVRSFSNAHRIGDYPGMRKVHTTFIPRMGGLGIIAGWGAGLCVAFLLRPSLLHLFSFGVAPVAASLSCIVALGLYDDVKGIGSFGKLVVQVLAATILFRVGLAVDVVVVPFAEPIHLGLFSYPVTVLWLVGVTNAINLIDGLDGLAAGVSAIVAASFALVGFVLGDPLLQILSVALIFACGGFLKFNFHPASIFMGDTGSLFLGFALSVLSLQLIRHPGMQGMPILFMVPVVALALPIVDTSVAFFRRVKKGMHPLKPDKEHFHHRLMELGLTHRQTVFVAYAITVYHGFVAFLLILVDSMYASVLLALVIASALFGIWRLGYLEEMTSRRRDHAPPIQPLNIARIIDKIVLAGTDAVAVTVAFVVTYWFRFQSGFLPVEGYVPLEMYVISPGMLIMVVGWLALFFFGGLYDLPWDVSRIDYALAIVKVAFVGTIVLFAATFDPQNPTVSGRTAAVLHGGSVALFVIVSRMLVIAFERRNEILGFRRRNTIIVGTDALARAIFEEIHARPGLKYEVVGMIVRHSGSSPVHELPVLGEYKDIPDVVKKHHIEEVLVATDYQSREEILEIVARCDGMVPAVKVASGNVDILSGFRTEEIIGHPLLRVYPTSMKRWQWLLKRVVDIAVSVVVLVPLFPLWLAVGLVIKMDSAGPVLFKQERIGKKGRVFTLYKFRSMIQDAERDTGPIWAVADDKRMTRVGRVIRKLRIDEVPQFLNVLKGEMSLVGPRPEREYFVSKFTKEIGFYNRRLLIRPGITGWAQVKHRYDTSIEDVREKVQYDLYYLENMSLRLDLKIILRTIWVSLRGKGTH